MASPKIVYDPEEWGFEKKSNIISGPEAWALEDKIDAREREIAQWTDEESEAAWARFDSRRSGFHDSSLQLRGCAAPLTISDIPWRHFDIPTQPLPFGVDELDLQGEDPPPPLVIRDKPPKKQPQPKHQKRNKVRRYVR